MSEQYIQVTTTIGSAEEARQIAKTLVEHRLAACIQIAGPLESIYRWQGEVETASEWQCIAKTSLDRYPEVEAAIRKIHSYETPEIIVTPIIEGSEAYLRWLKAAIE